MTYSSFTISLLVTCKQTPHNSQISSIFPFHAQTPKISKSGKFVETKIAFYRKYEECKMIT